ncbi:MAG TPA: polyprenol monophosphomannose synthase [Desulfobacteria bacterium]|nr:polyprenol monophosphomannose synthase [Desulfobacteria bacterium]
MLSVIVPTYNESQNVSLLSSLVAQVLAAIDYELIFVDDSTDNTPQVLEELRGQDSHVRYLHREGERGLGTAVVNGFRIAKGEFIAVMDADLQHPPEALPAMLKAIQAGADLVIPSRFRSGGSDGGLKLHRKLVSWVARVCGKVLLKRLRGISDPTGGFFMLRRQVIERVSLNPIGWKILIEVLVRGDYQQVAELPYTFAPRAHNISKMGWREQFEYLQHLIRLVERSPEDRLFWQTVYREVLASCVAIGVFAFACYVVPDHVAALLAALAFVPANRRLNLPVKVKRFPFAPYRMSARYPVAVLTSGVGWVLLCYLVINELFKLPPLLAFTTGALARTTGIIISALGINLSPHPLRSK